MERGALESHSSQSFPALTLPSHVISFSVPQFPHLEHGDNVLCPGIYEDRVRWCSAHLELPLFAANSISHTAVPGNTNSKLSPVTAQSGPEVVMG